jgi:tripartite-type tricarboxylate transporter receptor subunit TctC
MKIPRRQFLHLAAGAAALPAVSRIARAQTYPTRPVTMIVPCGAGGPSDTIGRILAEGLRGVLGQPVVIENAAGASGTIGVGRVARIPERAGASLTMWPGPIGATVQRGNRRTIMVPWRSAGLPKHEKGDR